MVNALGVVGRNPMTQNKPEYVCKSCECLTDELVHGKCMDCLCDEMGDIPMGDS